MANNISSLLALDVGDKRIGVALASTAARIASPLMTIPNDTTTIDRLISLIREHNVGSVVVGVPRGLSAQETDQTKRTREFIRKLEHTLAIPVYEQDETLTSKHAEAELRSKKRNYGKEDIDKLAAALILEDYLHASAR